MIGIGLDKAGRLYDFLKDHPDRNAIFSVKLISRESSNDESSLWKNGSDTISLPDNGFVAVLLLPPFLGLTMGLLFAGTSIPQFCMLLTPIV